MAANLEVKSAPWRSPLSTAIRKDEDGTKDTFQHLEKLLASAVSICRLKGTLECQTGGLITVCEEMQRLLRCSFSEIARLEKDLRKLQTNHDEELAHLKKKVKNIEQEKDNAKLLLENMMKRLDNTMNEEGIESQKVGAAPNEELVMDSRFCRRPPGSSEVSADCKVRDVNEIEDPVQGNKSKLCQGSNLQSKESNGKDSSQQQDENKFKPHGGDVGVTAAAPVEGLLVSQTRALSRNRLSRLPSKKTAKQSHGTSSASSSEDINKSVSSDAEQISEENGKTHLIDETSTEDQSGIKKRRMSRNPKKTAANDKKGNSKKPSDGVESKLPAESDNSEVVVLEVKANKMDGSDADTLENTVLIKHSPSSAPKKKNAKASGNLAKDSKPSDGVESKLPAESDNGEVVVLEVKGNKMDGRDADTLENTVLTKHSPSSAPKKKNAKASGNLAKDSKESSGRAKETKEKIQETEASSPSLDETLQTPQKYANCSKNIEGDEPLGDMSFLLDVNLKISEFVTNSEQELELQQMTARQRTDVYKLVQLYSVRVRMGSKSDSLTTLRLSKTPDSRMPKNGKVDCLLSRLSIAATKEAERAESPKLRAEKRKQLSQDDRIDGTTKKHSGKAKKEKRKKKA